MIRARAVARKVTIEAGGASVRSQTVSLAIEPESTVGINIAVRRVLVRGAKLVTAKWPNTSSLLRVLITIRKLIPTQSAQQWIFLETAVA